MKSAQDVFDELNELDEHPTIEAKTGKGDSLFETICAFSNEPDLGGGIILLGIEQDINSEMPTYKVKGINNPDKISAEIASECSGRFNVPIRPLIKTEKLHGKIVIIIYVNEVSDSEKPVYFKNKNLPSGAYRRIGSTDQKCTEDDLTILFSGRNKSTYDETICKDADLNDIDPDSVNYYRNLRKNANPAAEELLWSDEDLLLSLCALKKENGILYPTVCGILLFGTRKALRRLFPMMRVDYMRLPGKEWIEDPDNRFTTIEMKGSLLQLAQRINEQVFEDIPKTFYLEEGQSQAKSLSLPAKVLREAIVNAFMHGSYRANQPIQIRRYNNRIEIENAGYSLKNEDQLGEAGSRPRNPKIASIFHDTNLAETKGSGIRTMRRLMQQEKFAPPTFESSREKDSFVTRLLLHHFLTEQDLVWLKNLGHDDLNDHQKQSLVFIRETGAIDNKTYRQLSGVDTLCASKDLRRLCEIELLELKGKASNAYYLPTKKIIANTHQLEGKTYKIEANTPQLEVNTHQPEGKTHQLNFNTHQLPEYLKEKISELGKNPRKDKTQKIILDLCMLRPFSSEELTEILGKADKKYLVRTFLKPLIQNKTLVYTIPNMISHPDQKYKTPNKIEGIL